MGWAPAVKTRADVKLLFAGRESSVGEAIGNGTEGERLDNPSPQPSPASGRGSGAPYEIARSTFPTFSTISPTSSSLTISGGERAMVSPAMRNIKPMSWKARSIAS